jgi:hypothetical protein
MLHDALAEHIGQSIAKAWKHQSRLPPETLEIGGRTSPKIRHLLNNLCSLPDTVFLEVGSWKGASFVAALTGNEDSVTEGYAIDNWRCRGGGPIDVYSESERLFDEARTRFLSRYGDRQHKIKQDLFTVESLPDVPTIFYYDADHGQTGPGSRHFFNMIADPCIVCLDDWSWDFVQSGWRKACVDGSRVVVREWELPNNKPKDTELWWEGFYVCILTRAKA